MNLVVLVILALVWAVFLIPQVVRSRREVRPADSIGAFQRHLSVLERAAPNHPGTVEGQVRVGPEARTTAPRLATPSRADVRRRRRDVLVGLLAAMAGSLVLGLIPGLRVLLVVHLVLDVLFVAYVVLLVRARNAAAERDLKVRYLPSRTAPDPSLLLRRSVN